MPAIRKEVPLRPPDIWAFPDGDLLSVRFLSRRVQDTLAAVTCASKPELDQTGACHMDAEDFEHLVHTHLHGYGFIITRDFTEFFS